MSINASANAAVQLGKITLHVGNAADLSQASKFLIRHFTLSNRVAAEMKVLHKAPNEARDEILLIKDLGKDTRTGIFSRQWYRARMFVSSLMGKVRKAIKAFRAGENN